MKYNLKFYRKDESIKICSLWNSALVWDFRSKGYIEFYIENNFRDCGTDSFANLVYNNEISFLMANIFVFFLSLLEILISCKKCWRNFMLFLKIKYKLEPKRRPSSKAEFDSDNLSICTNTDSDIMSINNNKPPRKERILLNVSDETIIQEEEKELEFNCNSIFKKF